MCNALDDAFHTLAVENVTESCSADDPPHRVCFVQPEYRVMEDDGGVDVSVRLNGTSARADITVRVSARSTGNGDLDASGTCAGYAVNSVLCTAKMLGSCIYLHFGNSLFNLTFQPFLTPLFSPHLLFQVTPGGDISDAEWNVTIPAGETEAMFEISVIADSLAEADEMFTLELTVLEEPYFAVPCGDTATVVIENDGM